MTEKEIKKLKRSDLLEILVEQGKEIEKLRAEVESLQEKLQNRTITIDKAGTLAEAAFQLNGVFEAAQAASTQYLENIQHLSERQEEVCAKMEHETWKKCEEKERETEEKCAKMLAEAQKGADERWNDISQRLEAFYEAHQGMRELLKTVGDVGFGIPESEKE